jgi:hypothetical protein
VVYGAKTDSIISLEIKDQNAKIIEIEKASLRTKFDIE